MTANTKDPQVEPIVCSSWHQIRDQLEQFEPASVTWTEEDEVALENDWIFRGLESSCYDLAPTIEREARPSRTDWPAVEQFVIREFKSRSRMHAAGTPKDEFSWLAQMQHYGVPTRLLDFTYSPFVALHFATRALSTACARTTVRIWAINAHKINKRFQSVAFTAEAEERERSGAQKYQTASLHPYDMYTPADTVRDQLHGLQALVAKSLAASSTFRGVLAREGGVAAAAPPAFNPRLASQQGVFLVNCAEELDFGLSLEKMMKSTAGEWCKCFDVTLDDDQSLDIQRRLLQMNIHEQSLFPDMEGLAGFIRQKTRLQWTYRG